MTIDWSDFQKIDIRVGTIIAINDFPRARKPAINSPLILATKLVSKSPLLK